MLVVLFRAPRLCLVAATALAGFVFAGSAQAATINVDVVSDVVANDGHCSLREAVSSANNDSASGGAAGECPAGTSSDVVLLASASTYRLERVGIDDDNTGGDLDVLHALTIRPGGPGEATVVQTAGDRVIDVHAESVGSSG
jgi:hypothetical protein